MYFHHDIDYGTQLFSVASSVDTHCETPEYMTIRSEDGYLASHVTQSSGAGSVDCPWIIEVGEGQTIQLTMFDFSGSTSGNQLRSRQCNVYAIIKERSAGVSETVCGSTERISTIYTSVTHQVEVRLVYRGQHNTAFMVRYQGQLIADDFFVLQFVKSCRYLP